jgi:hypothetical protein
VLQHALTFAIKRKIALAGDACFRPPIIIIFHDLYASKIRGAMGEIAPYHERGLVFSLLWPSLLSFV